MCLIEPVIGPNIDALKNVAQYPIMASRNRRDEWPSRYVTAEIYHAFYAKTDITAFKERNASNR